MGCHDYAAPLKSTQCSLRLSGFNSLIFGPMRVHHPAGDYGKRENSGKQREILCGIWFISQLNIYAGHQQISLLWLMSDGMWNLLGQFRAKIKNVYLVCFFSGAVPIKHLHIYVIIVDICFCFRMEATVSSQSCMSTEEPWKYVLKMSVRRPKKLCKNIYSECCQNENGFLLKI